MVSDEGGVIYLISHSIYNDTNSTFKNNIAYDGGAIVSTLSNISLNGTIFEYNYAKRVGGAIQLVDKSYMNTFYNVTALGNEASGSVGVINCESESYFLIQSSSFLNNTSYDTSVLYSLLCNNQSKVEDSNFSYNNSTIGGTIKSILTNFTIYDTTFEDNFSLLQTSSIYIAFWMINITEWSFINSDSNSEINSISSKLTGGFLFFTADSYIEINNSNFTNGVANSGGAIYSAGDCIITIIGWNFKNNAANRFGGFMYSNNNDITINNSTFYRNIGRYQASDIYVTFGAIRVFDSSFEVGKRVSIYTTSATTKLNGVQMIGYGTSSQNFTSDFGAGVYAEDTTDFVVESSTFTNLTFGQAGGAIAIFKTGSLTESYELPDTTYYTIRNSTFTSNIAFVGGAIYAYNIETVLISNCSFNSNKAVYNSTIDNSGLGGAIFYSTIGKYLWFKAFYSQSVDFNIIRFNLYRELCISSWGRVVLELCRNYWIQQLNIF